MSLKAQDFLPLLNNLSHEAQVRLERLALSVGAGTGSMDSRAYGEMPEGRYKIATR